MDRGCLHNELQQTKNINGDLRQEMSSIRLKMQDLEMQVQNLKSVNMSLNAQQSEYFRLQGVDSDLKRAN